MKRMIALVALASLLTCCGGIPADALRLTEVSLERRQLQTRRYDTSDEASVLSACAALLQDLGFTLDESESELGVIVASKERDATEAGQVALAIFLTALSGSEMYWDDEQKIRVSVVTRPIGERSEDIAVRVTFQRLIWNNKGVLWKVQGLYDPEHYQEFFAMLSKSLFLEAHEL
ncbi:MAG: hypothetical protein O7B99_04715 [Planctomycetota bacterium]|nr:hypothetical protein [Planctomycetota bacterium]